MERIHLWTLKQFSRLKTFHLRFIIKQVSSDSYRKMFSQIVERILICTQYRVADSLSFQVVVMLTCRSWQKSFYIFERFNVRLQHLVFSFLVLSLSILVITYSLLSRYVHEILDCSIPSVFSPCHLETEMRAFCRYRSEGQPSTKNQKITVNIL